MPRRVALELAAFPLPEDLRRDGLLAVMSALGRLFLAREPLRHDCTDGGAISLGFRVRGEDHDRG